MFTGLRTTLTISISIGHERQDYIFVVYGMNKTDRGLFVSQSYHSRTMFAPSPIAVQGGNVPVFLQNCRNYRVDT